MPRTSFLSMALLSGFVLMLSAPARGQEETAESAAKAGEFIPGFESDKLTWAQAERIELIEGETREADVSGKEVVSSSGSVVVYRFADGGTRPLSITKDPLAEPLPENAEKIDYVARLKARAVPWKEQLLEHNPAIRLDILHRDTQKQFRLLSGFQTRHRLHFQENIHTPTEEQVAKARAVDTKAILEKMQVHSDNKARAKIWYYAANALLVLVALAIVVFVLLPLFRRGKGAPTPPAT